MSARRAAARRAARSAKSLRPFMVGVVPDPVAAYTIASAAETFIHWINEARENLAGYERDGLDLHALGLDPEDGPWGGHAPGVDPEGRALIALCNVLGGPVHIFHTRRTRGLAFWTTDARLRFVRAVKAHPRTAAQSVPARKARQAFRDALTAARGRDKAMIREAGRV